MIEGKNETSYDSSLDFSYSFYDHLPYTRNMDFCGDDCVRVYSGNVYKHAYCKESDVRVISNHDDVMKRRIEEQLMAKHTEEEETEELPREEE